VVTVDVYGANGVPLTTSVAVRSVPLFSVYTIVYGPVPAVAVHVSCPDPLAQKGPLALRLPCGSGFTVITALPSVKPLLLTHVVV
jgi:hypothetical protein